MKKRFTMLIFGILMVVVAAGCSSCREKNSNDTAQNEADEELPSNFVAFGMYSNERDYIDNGSSLNRETAENHMVEIEQNLNREVKYLLLAFADYRQVSFYVDGTEYVKFPFSLDKKGTRDINISHSQLSDCRELTYLIIPDCEEKVQEDDIEQLLNISSIYSMRYLLDFGTKFVPEAYKEPQKAIIDQEGIFLSSSEKEQEVLTVVKRDFPLYLHIAVKDPEVKDYLFFMLNDWEQVPIGEDFYFYLKNDPSAGWIQEINVSGMEPDSNFQIVGIPNPFQDFDFYSNKAVYYTHRIHVVE